MSLNTHLQHVPWSPNIYPSLPLHTSGQTTPSHPTPTHIIYSLLCHIHHAASFALLITTPTYKTQCTYPPSYPTPLNDSHSHN